MIGTHATTKAELQQIILAQLRGLAPEADLNDLRPHDDIRETLEIDAFDFLNFLIALNKETGVEVPEKDYGRVSTLESLATYLLAHM
ncbi:MAG: acyl carrier protein [Caldilineaceae bacterium]|nr:acyl carrier protein [Caldilineaceae bacterium]MCB0136173.1 acyl carrier protein [Caldilineaceae bacterium]HRW48545.1 acyl carrier protein [Caldilinea sp.]